jgi:hypothetical protein
MILSRWLSCITVTVFFCASGCTGGAKYPARSDSEFIPVGPKNANQLAGFYRPKSESNIHVLLEEGYDTSTGEGNVFRVEVVSEKELNVWPTVGKNSKPLQLHGHFSEGYFVLNDNVAFGNDLPFPMIEIRTKSRRLGLDGHSNLLLDGGSGWTGLFLGIYPLVWWNPDLRNIGLFERVQPTTSTMP